MSKNIGRRASAQDNFIGPNAPTGLTATNHLNGVNNQRPFNNGMINLAWTAPAAGNTPTQYKVFRNGTEIATVNAPTVTYSDTGLAGGTSYSYTVKAVDSFNTSADSNSASATATTVPAAPTSVSATAGVNANTVSWAAPSNGGTAITNYYIAGNDGTTGNSTGLSVSIADTAGTSQYYNVYADNANGRSVASSNSNTVTTLAPSFFSPPFFPPFFPPSFFAPPFFPPFFPPVFFAPPFFPPFFPPSFFAPPFFPPGFFSPPGFFAPPGFFSPPGFFAPPGFFSPPAFGGAFGLRFY
jgi:hypothetical protein